MGKPVRPPQIAVMPDDKPAENEPWYRPFPVAEYWEDLRLSWEGNAGGDGPEANVGIRNEVLRLASKVTNTALPEGLVVDLEQVLELLKALHLHEDQFLAERLFQVAGRYLRPRHQAFLGTTAGETKQLLKKILKATRALDGLLEETAVEVTQVVETAHAELAQGFGHKPSLSVSKLSISLTELEQAVAWLENSIDIAANRPTKTMRLDAVINAALAIEDATGAPIELGSRKSGTAYRDRFKGAGGSVLLNFLKLIAPESSEAALVKDLRDARKRLTRKKSGS